MHAVINPFVRGTVIILAASIPDISGRQLAREQVVRLHAVLERASAEIDLQAQGRRIQHPGGFAAWRQIFTMLIWRIKVHLALCSTEQFRKDSALAPARQCCDCSMGLCDRSCSNNQTSEKRAADMWEIADAAIPAHSMHRSMASMEVRRSSFRESR
ncbi:hypothetical protein ST47_g9262 [Ascochyta rabiei]|uniref:Uncharacterized protein n=1 Tax=Didymella rabiei TaxID=5454 RepID=A0A162XGR1_DIDRA|nr:hypothetical protein ST47_g9262 [Ascochyta rabiei]